MHASYERVGGQAKLRFERLLAHSVERVWYAITEMDELAHWFPDTIAGKLAPAGRLQFRHGDGSESEGEVREIEPLQRLVFTWGGDLLEFELRRSDAGGCILDFTVTIAEVEKAARDASGWHLCLDRLGVWLAGHDAPPPAPGLGWRRLYEDYAERGFPTGAVIPEIVE
jgi:uncharacterized protein YndB with AHSA1/START domain